MQTQKRSKCDGGWNLNEAAIPVESCGADLHDKGQTFQNGPFPAALLDMPRVVLRDSWG